MALTGIISLKYREKGALFPAINPGSFKAAEVK
jgi:hypothetical protein